MKRDLQRQQTYVGVQLTLDIDCQRRHLHYHMDYYHCPFEQLCREIERRGYIPCGGHDELSEGLTRDDNTRGADATIVETVVKDSAEPRSRKQIAEYGQPIDPSLLVGESESLQHCQRKGTSKKLSD